MLRKLLIAGIAALATAASAQMLIVNGPSGGTVTPDSGGGGGSASWTERSTATGVLVAENTFSTATILANDYEEGGSPVGNGSRETSIVMSGAGAYRVDNLTSDGAQSGAMRLSLGEIRGNGSTTYYSFGIYTPASRLRTMASYGGGEKGWKLTNIAKYGASNTDNEVVLQSTDLRGFIRGYYQDGSNFVGTATGASTPCNSSNFRYTNQIDAGGGTPSTCDEYEARYGLLYQNTGLPGNGSPSSTDMWEEGFPSPYALQSGLIPFTPDGWTYIKAKVTIGTLGTGSSSIDWYACRPGDASWQHQHSVTGITLGTENGGHDAIWLSGFYDTNRTSSSVNTFGVWDEVIVSENDIACGGHINPWAYSLPSEPGAVVEISQNTAADIKPSGWTDANWGYALFYCYGGGIYVPDYSEFGAWVIAGSGGHGCPENVGAAAFNFSTGAWELIEPSNSASDFFSETAYTSGDTGGSPDYLLTGSSGIPAPAHVGQALAWWPRSLGGGLRGSVINAGRWAITTASANSYTDMAMSLTSGLWSEPTSGDPANNRTSVEMVSVYDDTRDRIWVLTGNQNVYSNLAYLDLSGFSPQWGVTSSYTAPSDPHRQGAAWMYGGYLVRHGDDDGLYVYDPDTNTWGNPSITGGANFGSNDHAHAWYPPTGKFYQARETPGTTLYTLTPPGSSPLTNNWTASTVTLDTSLPSRYSSGNGAVHHNSLFYVPLADTDDDGDIDCCLAWVEGGQTAGGGVYLIQPE